MKYENSQKTTPKTQPSSAAPTAGTPRFKLKPKKCQCLNKKDDDQKCRNECRWR